MVEDMCTKWETTRYDKVRNCYVAELSPEKRELLFQEIRKILKYAEERAELEGWIDAENLERELRMDS